MKAVLRKAIPFTAVLLAMLLFSGCRIIIDIQALREAFASPQPIWYPTPSPTAEATAAPTESPTAVPTATPEALPSETAEPSQSVSPTAVPVPDPEAEAAALALAEAHGMSADDLYGQYGLFLRYAAHVEGNAALAGYRDYFYRLFIAVAANAGCLDEQYFFKGLDGLTIREAGDNDLYAGEYSLYNNRITLYNEEPEDRYRTIYHELVHFVDHYIAEEPGTYHLLDGRLLTGAEFSALSPADQLKAKSIFSSKLYSPIATEACAELFTAKYFTGSVVAYNNVVAFVTGLEYIFGLDTVREMFFSPETDLLWARLFMEHGYSYEECLAINDYLAYITDWDKFEKPEETFSPEDILIGFYNDVLEDDWQQDMRFLYILNCINGVSGSDYTASQYSDFLMEHNFITTGRYDVFERRLVRGMGISARFYLMPLPVLEGENFWLCAAGIWRDPETGEQQYGTMVIDYDFDTEEVLGYSLMPGE